MARNVNAKAGYSTPITGTIGLTHDEWLAYRRTGIGGSDASTIVGLNPFSSQFYLYNDKKGALPPKETTESMRQGTDLEQYVADRWAERTGKTCRKNNHMWRSNQWPWMLADVDREVVGENAGLECKTTSPFSKSDFEGGEIPPYYYVQCQHYMAVRGYERMYLAVLVFSKGFYTFVIERDEAEIEALAQAEREFWELVTTNTPPPIDGSDATREAIQQLHPDDAANLSTVSLEQHSAELSRLHEMQKVQNELKAACDEIKNKITADMGNRSFATAGAFTCTWKTQQRTSLDTCRLKSEHPDIFEEYQKTTTSRIFKLSKEKGE